METIRIDEKHYDASKLTEQAVALLNDLQKVENELGRLTLSVSITNLAKSTLIDKLVAETANLTDAEVPAPVAE